MTITTIARTGYQKYAIGISSRSSVLLFILIFSVLVIRVPCGSIGFSKSSVAEVPVLLVGEIECDFAGTALDQHREDVLVFECLRSIEAWRDCA